MKVTISKKINKLKQKFMGTKLGHGCLKAYDPAENLKTLWEPHRA